MRPARGCTLYTVSEPVAPDFVVIAPLEEEREAMLGLLPAARRLPPDEHDVRIYYAAELPVRLSDGAAGAYRLIITSPLGMGRVEAAAATSDAIHRFNPRYVLLVGIAGGVADAVARGDVLVADQFVDYEQQKLTEQGPQIRYQAYRADARLLIAAQHLRNWQQTLTATRPDQRTPRRHVGPIVSGDKLMASRDGLRAYLQDWPKLLGIEMEAGGVASAAFQAASKPGVLMIRGVSEAADTDKDGAQATAWRQYACEVAAAYTLALLSSGPVPFADVGQLQRKQLIEQLSQRLKIPASACQLILDKSEHWEIRLFGQVLCDEIENLAGLTRDYQLGISLGPRSYLDTEALLQRVKETIQEIKGIVEGLDALLNVSFREAMGPPGEPGSPDALVYTARRIVDIYRQALEWAMQWNQYEVDEDCRMLLTLLGQAPIGVIGGIQDFHKKYKSVLSQLAEVEKGEDRVVFKLNIDVASSGEMLSHISDEVRRLSRRRLFKFW